MKRRSLFSTIALSALLLSTLSSCKRNQGYGCYYGYQEKSIKADKNKTGIKNYCLGKKIEEC